MALNSNEIKKGTVILYNNEPHLVLSHDFHKMGRGGNHNKTKLKNLLSGSIIPVTFSGNERADEADVAQKNVQYLYNDGQNGMFMDPKSFEQYEIALEEIPGGTDYMKEGELYQCMFFDGNPISIIPPKKIALKVTEAAEAVKGDTANNPQKEVTLETGARLRVPLFIKQGETIYVNTDDHSYTGRDNS